MTIDTGLQIDKATLMRLEAAKETEYEGTAGEIYYGLEDAVKELNKTLNREDLTAQERADAEQLLDTFAQMRTLFDMSVGLLPQDLKADLPEGMDEKYVAARNADKKKEVLTSISLDSVNDLLSVALNKLQSEPNHDIKEQQIRILNHLIDIVSAVNK